MKNRFFLMVLGFFLSFYLLQASYEDPAGSRLFLVPTADTLSAGEVRLSLYELIFPEIAVGITDFLTFRGGFSLRTEEGILIYFLPRVRVLKRENFSFSAGAFFSLNASYAEEKAGALYVLATYGNRDNSITLGLGQGFDVDKNGAWLLAGTSLRIFSHCKVIGEGIFISGGSGLATGGVRFYMKDLSFDAGIVLILSEGLITGFLPWLSFSYRFHL